MRTPLLLGWWLLLAGCAPSALGPLVMDGQALHRSLATRELDDASRLHVPRAVLRDNPYLSTDAEFVGLVARGASQGRLGGEGIRSALYAHYIGESELGFYGLEAVSTADADRREAALRGIWEYNESLGRARVHREGKVVVVVWHGGVSRSCWEAVNAKIVERLAAPWAVRNESSSRHALSMSCPTTACSWRRCAPQLMLGVRDTAWELN